MKEYKSIERTFVMVKPDGVKRALSGKIIKKLEEAGLKLVTGRMIWPNEDQAKGNYPSTDKAWIEGLGGKALAGVDGDYERLEKGFGSKDLSEVGHKIYEKLVELLMSGPVIIMVWEGNHAVEHVRTLVGKTVPRTADAGTIRADWAFDSPALAADTGRIALGNLVHASGNSDEAKTEMEHWFGKDLKFQSYDRADHEGLFNDSWIN
jgi:nucleoside-diphosphate kinase